MAENVNASEDICVICCYTSDFYCLGQCDHPVCFECGTRLRVLCESNECSICRAQLTRVYVVIGAGKAFTSVGDSKFIRNNQLSKKYGFCFENEEALSAVGDILAHVCTICKNEPSFDTFQLLSEHMRRTHQLFYCDLCVEHLKLFSWERKCYNRNELARHRRSGDPDDRSHTGHPLCEFCDERYLDDDFLFRHLRRDHFFCHFCDADGKNKFYPDVDRLKNHFKEYHFLCEVGQCKSEHMGVSFRNEIDLKAHKATVHGKEIQKNELRKEMQVNVGFNFGPTPSRERFSKQADRQPRRRERAVADVEEQRVGDRRTKFSQTNIRVVPAEQPSEETLRQLPPSTTPNFQIHTEEFPSLLKNSHNRSMARQSLKTQSLLANVVAANIVRSGSLGENDFPVLTANGSGRFRRDSRSVSPKVTAIAFKGLRLVDDDELFSDDQTEMATAQEKKMPAGEKVSRDKAPATAPNWGRQKMTAGYTNEVDFPSLPSKSRKKNKLNSSEPSSTKSAWSRKVANQPLKKEVETKPAISKLNPKEFPALVSLPKTKARARLVAQNQQRPSAEECHVVDDSKPATGDGMAGDTFPSVSQKAPTVDILAPPPGLILPHPPGFEPVPIQLVASTTLPPFAHDFTKPNTFQVRNRALFDLLSENLSEERLREFKLSSSSFRKGETSADNYYHAVKTLLGKKLFSTCFPELVCLLPDIKKQNDLLAAQRLESGRSGGPWQNILLESIRCCNICRQLLSAGDFAEHCSLHTSDDEYPVLPRA